jgi:hypothetical protein
LKKREEKNSAPRCPYCGTDLQRPAEIAISDTEKGPGGVCACGAVYLVDPTGKNVGTLMAQALLMAADVLGKSVGDLVPDEDYQDAILSYDGRTHRSTGVSKGYRDRYGRLYIIKVRKSTK